MTEEKMELDGADKKGFAREQYEFLKKQGIKDRMKLSRIFKAAGPGQVQDAWKLASSEATLSRQLLLGCIALGMRRLEMTKDEISEILRINNFQIPDAKNEIAFRRIIDGALEILFPGSFWFSKRQLQEINDGLKKLVHQDKE